MCHPGASRFAGAFLEDANIPWRNEEPCGVFCGAVLFGDFSEFPFEKIGVPEPPFDHRVDDRQQ